MLLRYVSYALALISLAGASPLSAQDSERPELLRDIIENLTITAENTINGTVPPENPRVQSNPLKLTIQNNEKKGQVYAYIRGRDMDKRVVMVDTSGQFYYPDPAGSTLPVRIPADANVALPVTSGSNDFVLPDYMESARIYLSDDALQFSVLITKDGLVTFVDPAPEAGTDTSANIRVTFMEFNYLSDGRVKHVNANLSFGDWWGLVTGLRLTLGGTGGGVQTARGLDPDAPSAICAELKTQATLDGQPWDDLCVTRDDGQLVRIRSPAIYISKYHDAMADYYAAYVDEVYSKYAEEDLIIDTQGSFGLVSCRVTRAGDELVCQGDSIPYHKPSAKDIFSCDSGPFANIGDALHKSILVRLCAAFHRSELLLPGGNVTPSLHNDTWYKVNPTNHYSRIIHKHELDGKGYTFPYDDVHPPNTPDVAGSVAGLNPELLEVFVGGGI